MLLKSDTAPMVPLMLGASVPMDEVFADLDSWRLVLFALVTSWPVPNELEDDALECEIQQKNVQLGKKGRLTELMMKMMVHAFISLFQQWFLFFSRPRRRPCNCGRC